jgi:hypothetical protein
MLNELSKGLDNIKKLNELENKNVSDVDKKEDKKEEKKEDKNN